jgi:integrase
MKGFVRNRGGVKQANGTYRGGTWTAYWDDRNADGSRWQRSKGGFTTRRAANEFLFEVLATKRQDLYVTPGRTTLGSYLVDSWLPAQQQRRPATTLLNYRRVVRNHVLSTIGDLPLQDLDGRHLDRLYADLMDHGGIDGRPLKRKTVRGVHALLRKALADATRKRLVARNVAVDADPPKIGGPGSHELAVWTPEELRQFLDAIAPDRIGAAYALAAATGMRRGEVLGLRWCDVDLDNGTVAVCQTIVAVSDEIQLSEPKTARGRRTISIDPRTTATLRSHLQRQLEEPCVMEMSIERDDFVFSTLDGGPIHPHTYSTLFNTTVAKLGLRRIRRHDLRHTYATLALRAGVDAKTVSARLGHATVAFTLDVYTKAVPQVDREAADKVADLSTAPNERVASPAVPTPPGQPVLELLVELRDVEPRVWRRLLVPGSVRLDKLHRMLQAAMGWEDCHLHSFEIDGARYGTQFDEYPEAELQEKSFTVIGAVGSSRRFAYEYDFGDDWEHDISVEATWRMPIGLKLAVCLDGANACPPEDCGGAPGYEDLLRVLADPTHADHEHMRGWVGGPFDPHEFVLPLANARLQTVR